MIHLTGKNENFAAMTKRRTNGGNLFVVKVQKAKPVPPSKVVAVHGKDFHTNR